MLRLVDSTALLSVSPSHLVIPANISAFARAADPRTPISRHQPRMPITSTVGHLDLTAAVTLEF
jgi:hypothetical protein